MTVKNKKNQKFTAPQNSGFIWLIIIPIIFCELLFYTWIRIESTQTIFRIAAKQQELAGKTSYHKALSLERDRLKSDDRITLIAKTRLNLFTDTIHQTIYLPDSPAKLQPDFQAEIPLPMEDD